MSRQRACCCSPDWESDGCCVMQTTSGGSTVDQCPQQYFVAWSGLSITRTTTGGTYNGATSSWSVPDGKNGVGIPDEVYQVGGDCRATTGNASCIGLTNVQLPNCEPSASVPGQFTKGWKSHWWLPLNQGAGWADAPQYGCPGSVAPTTSQVPNPGPYQTCNGYNGLAVTPTPPSFGQPWDGTYQKNTLEHLRIALYCFCAGSSVYDKSYWCAITSHQVDTSGTALCNQLGPTLNNRRATLWFKATDTGTEESCPHDLTFSLDQGSTTFLPGGAGSTALTGSIQLTVL